MDWATDFRKDPWLATCRSNLNLQTMAKQTVIGHAIIHVQVFVDPRTINQISYQEPQQPKLGFRSIHSA